MNGYERIIKTMRSEAKKNPREYHVLLATMTGPTSCKVGDNLELDEDDLYIPTHFTDYTTNVTIDWESEQEEQTHIHSGFHGPTGTQSAKHTHKITGKKEITVHNALEEGDVVLITKITDEMYAILEKVVSD